MNLTKYFSKVNTQAKWYRIMTRVIFPLILLLHPLRHVSMGIDLTDTGYSLGNFVFFKQMEGMWVFATYLANAVGYLLTRLPFGWTMLGMNVYTGLFISVTALVSYCFLIKEYL